MNKTIVWFRQDLRLTDNPALAYASEQGAILPVFIFPEGLGGASYWWLHHSLSELMASLSEQGVELLLLSGKPEHVLSKLAQDHGCQQVVWNRVYSPIGMAQGEQVKTCLAQNDIKARSFNGELLIEPSKVFNKQGTPFKVFTPFWKHVLTQLNPSDVCGYTKLEPVEWAGSLNSEKLVDWNLLPTKPDWSAGLDERWQPGEDGAQARWQAFLDDTINYYKTDRDKPAVDATSYLSPHLAFGEISVRQLYLEVQYAIAANTVDAENAQKFIAEIGWREYSRYLLVHFPDITEQPFNKKFVDFPWQFDQEKLTAWQKGKTGYPLVDAGMRELWHTGYMHNRVRMVVASFLSKHCLIHWHYGMQWFWDTLVDADLPNNTASWQWVAGCGADASPYFRIFNPIVQGERFDPNADYIRRWVPELAALPNKYVHQPWLANESILQYANVRLGDNYPVQIVEHKQAREQALQAYQIMKSL